MQLILGLIYGVVYGISHVIPGLSGGTFLVIFGCYDKVCEAFALNFKVIKKHFFFFVMFGIGSVAGVIGFAHAITFLMERFSVQTHLFFMGLILGGIPLINKIATQGENGESEKWSAKCILPFILGFALIVGLFAAEKLSLFGGSAANTATDSFNAVFALKIVAYSAIAAIAMVLPGISGAFMFVAFGVYDTLMSALKELDLSVIIPAAIGILIGIVAGAKLVLFLLKRFKIIVYAAIMGMGGGFMGAPFFSRGRRGVPRPTPNPSFFFFLGWFGCCCFFFF
ncbi:MAG: DUF368 domain-containing protein, partial [Oscillospiraceae bacterium]|nr:DUF368 domain-containing protein [Oscillospiraceae bacterium]